jgi:SAM-dependent methyltransferase
VEPDKTQLDFLNSAGYKTEKDISHLPFESVDYVFTINVLEHINNDRAATENIFRILKHGGCLFIYVPALQWLYFCMDAADEYIRRYRIADLTAKVSDAGFIIRRREYVDNLGVHTSLIYKLVGP